MDTTKKIAEQEVSQNQEVKPEVLSVPEVTKESKEVAAEEPKQPQGETNDAQAVVQAVVAPVAPTPVPASVKDELSERIEDVLEEDMTDLFLTMSPADQQKFKEKGEQTVSQIRQMFTKAHVQTKKIFNLVRSWMKMIPGVNRFFLEQEAKIKTDKIKHLNE